MPGASIGPVNLTLRADASMIGQDMDKAMKQISLKGSVGAISPLLGLGGVGINKRLVKGLSSQLGAGGGELGGMLGGVAGALGPIGLGVMAGQSLFSGILNMARAADPDAVKKFDDAWSGLSFKLGSLFIPSINVATDWLQRFGAAGDKIKGSSGLLGQAVDYGIKESPFALGRALRNTMPGGAAFGALVGIADAILPSSKGAEAAQSAPEEPIKATLMSMDDYLDKLTVSSYETSGGQLGGIAGMIQDAFMAALEEHRREVEAADNRREAQQRALDS